jgi:cytochrome c553
MEGIWTSLRAANTGHRRVAAMVTGLVVAVASSPSIGAEAKLVVTTLCAACHGEDGNSTVGVYPKLAGLQADYIVKQIKDFVAGKRKNELMTPIAENLSSGDVPAIAAHFSAQKPAPGKVENPQLVAAGKRIFDDGNTTSGVPACAGCHLPNAAGNERFPRLAGQHQAYILQELTDLKSGLRANDRGRVMRAVAERMTEDEMKAVAEYIAGL